MSWGFSSDRFRRSLGNCLAPIKTCFANRRYKVVEEDPTVPFGGRKKDRSSLPPLKRNSASGGLRHLVDEGLGTRGPQSKRKARRWGRPVVPRSVPLSSLGPAIRWSPLRLCTRGSTRPWTRRYRRGGESRLSWPDVRPGWPAVSWPALARIAVFIACQSLRPFLSPNADRKSAHQRKLP